MDRTESVFIQELLDSHRHHMEQIARDNPVLTLRVNMKSQERRGPVFISAFEVINSSNSIKLSSMLEEKIRTNGKYPVTGTVVEVNESTITLSFPKRVPDSVTELIRNPNYNNEKLLKAAEDFLRSGKEVPEIFCVGKRCKKEGEEELVRSGDISAHAGDREAAARAISCDEKEAVGEDAKQSNPYNASTHEITAGCSVAPPGVVFYNENLNDSQRLAVCHSLLDRPFKILGPPGTGKTETIVEIISQLLERGNSVLVAGPSNTSVDNIILRFQACPFFALHNTPFYRLGSSSKGLHFLNLEAAADRSVDFMDSEAARLRTAHERRLFAADRALRRKEFVRKHKEASKVVFTTLFSSLKEKQQRFDVCIVDEACQASELECLMGVLKARRFILAGDPYQLASMTSRSLYERLSFVPEIVLRSQYRMPANLIAFSNAYFYSNRIVSPIAPTQSFAFRDGKNILFIDTSFCSQHEASRGTSKINSSEAEIVVKVIAKIREMMGGGEKETSIGVIVPYAAQAMLIESLREGIVADCAVDTVDGFQGQERDFMVIGLVRSNAEQEIGFLSDERRLNVAITRAKKGLVIVADAENFSKNKFFTQFFKFLDENAYVIDPEGFEMEF